MLKRKRAMLNVFSALSRLLFFAAVGILAGGTLAFSLYKLFVPIE